MNTLQKVKTGFVLSVVSFLLSVSAQAGLRDAGDFGINMNILHEPVATAYGFGISYHLAPEVRLGLAYGIMLGDAWGLNLKYLPNPDRPVSFAFGLGVARGKEFITDIFKSMFSGGEGDVGMNTYWAFGVSAGIDWQTALGFQLGLGAQYVVLLADASEGVVLPYLQIGWLF